MTEAPAPSARPGAASDSDAGLPIIVRTSGAKLRRWGWIAVAMGALSLLVALADAGSTGEDQVYALLGLLVFGGGGALMLMQAGRDRVVLEATTEGVTVGGGVIPGLDQAVGPVRWDEIAMVVVKDYKLARYLGFDLYEPERTLARFGAAYRLTGKISSFLPTSPLIVPITLFDGSPHRLRERLEALRAHALRTAGDV